MLPETPVPADSARASSSIGIAPSAASAPRTFAVSPPLPVENIAVPMEAATPSIAAEKIVSVDTICDSNLLRQLPSADGAVLAHLQALAEGRGTTVESIVSESLQFSKDNQFL